MNPRVRHYSQTLERERLRLLPSRKNPRVRRWQANFSESLSGARLDRPIPQPQSDPRYPDAQEAAQRGLAALRKVGYDPEARALQVQQAYERDLRALEYPAGQAFLKRLALPEGEAFLRGNKAPLRRWFESQGRILGRAWNEAMGLAATGLEGERLRALANVRYLALRDTPGVDNLDDLLESGLYAPFSASVALHPSLSLTALEGVYPARAIALPHEMAHVRTAALSEEKPVRAAKAVRAGELIYGPQAWRGFLRRTGRGEDDFVPSPLAFGPEGLPMAVQLAHQDLFERVPTSVRSRLAYAEWSPEEVPAVLTEMALVAPEKLYLMDETYGTKTVRAVNDFWGASMVRKPDNKVYQQLERRLKAGEERLFALERTPAEIAALYREGGKPLLHIDRFGEEELRSLFPR